MDTPKDYLKFPIGRNPIRSTPGVLTLIFSIGYLLRIMAVQFGLPDLFHADEPIVVNHALAYGSWDFHPHFFRIPPFASYLLFFIYGLAFLVGKIIGHFSSLESFEFLFYQDPSLFYFLGRLALGVIPGTFSIYTIYRLLDRHDLRIKALMAAFLFSVCYLHVKDSHFIYADILLIWALLGAWFPFWNLASRPSSRQDHLIAGLFVGLAMAIKYNGVLLVVPYLYLASRGWRRTDYLIRNLIRFSVAAFFMYAGLNPYSILDSAFFLEEIMGEAMAHQGGTSFFHHLLYSLREGMGTPLWCLSLFGLFQALRHRNPRYFSMALFVVVYYLVLWRSGQAYERYVLPILPFMIILATHALWGILSRFLKVRLWYLVAILIAVSFPSFVRCLLWDRIMLAEDTRTEAKNWIEARLPEDSRIALDGDFFMPRLQFTKAQIEEKIEEILSTKESNSIKLRKLNFLLQNAENKKGYFLHFMVQGQKEEDRFLYGKPLISHSWDALAEADIEYLVIQSDRPDREPQSFYESLPAKATLLARFSPYRDPEQRSVIDSNAMTGGPFILMELLKRNRNGPILEVYKIQAG